MTTALLEPGDCVVDYSSARPDLAGLVAAGVKAVSRYLGRGSSRGHDLTIAERDETWAAGLGFVPLNFELTAGRALLGYEAGVIDGQVAADQAAELGYPLDMPIVVSVDVGITAAQLPIVEAYFRGFTTTCPHELEAYSGTLVGDYLADRGLIAGIWQASASSWSPHPSARVYLLQHVIASHPEVEQWVASHQVDDDTVISPFRMWTGLGDDVIDSAALAHPPTKGNAMPDYFNNSEALDYNGASYPPGDVFFQMCDDGGKRHIEGPEGPARKLDTARSLTSDQIHAIRDTQPPATGAAVDVEAIAEAVVRKLATRLEN